MLEKRNNKSILNGAILLFLITCIFWSTNKVWAATLDVSPSSGSYRVGDLIQLKVLVNSETSINAIAAKIDFPIKLLTISSISKSGTIINLWAKEPQFSNTNGTISFEGIILSGFIDNGGNVITLNFKAKAEGTANIKFSSASVLANDGDGTEVISGSNSSVIKIDKALPSKVTPAGPIGEVNTAVQDVVQTCKDTIIKIQGVEASNNLPNNSLVIPIAILAITILVLIIIYCIYYINKFKKFFKKRLSKTEDSIAKDFETLENDVEKEILISHKIQTNEKITEEEVSSFDKLRKDVRESKESIIKEIKDIENDS